MTLLSVFNEVLKWRCFHHFT